MKVYDGKGPMRIATFFSGGASSGKAIMESPGHGSKKKYQTVCAVTNNKNAKAIEMYRFLRSRREGMTGPASSGALTSPLTWTGLQR